jgi:NADH:ubiquinone oxidoreductase subunit E
MKKETLTLLRSLKEKEGAITRENLERLSRESKVPLNELYSVATFYSYFGSRPQGKYALRLCKNMPCHMKGQGEILKALTEKLGIGPDGITKDKKFSLELVNCIGACDKAPAMLINGTLYGNLTQERVKEIIDACI